MESELLYEMKKMNGALGKQPRLPTGDHWMESGGFRYHKLMGEMSGNTIERMILVSVGNMFPANVAVKQRIKNSALAKKATQTFGSLPSIVPGLHEEAAADLMATASTIMKAPSSTVVQLCLDVPMMQRAKQYYLMKMKEFLQNCKLPVGKSYLLTLIYMHNHSWSILNTAVIHYLGHSEEGTGNWCFKDGTISFQEIFNLYRKHFTNKRMTIKSDCSYSGQWVRECAKTLDSLGIPPCGHRARENGALVKVCTSCQPNEEAAEPCYSIQAVRVEDDGTNPKQLTQQKSVWFDSTKLVCCRDPDSPCPKTTFKHLKWENAVDKTISIQRVKRKEGGRDMWYYIILHRAGDAYREEFRSRFAKHSTLRLSDWGYVLESGESKDIPQVVKDKVSSWTTVALT